MEVKAVCTASVTVNICCLSYWMLSRLFLVATTQRKNTRWAWRCHGFLVGRERTMAILVTENLCSWLIGVAGIYTLAVDRELWNSPFLTRNGGLHDMLTSLLFVAVGKHIYSIFFNFDVPVRHLHIVYSIISVFYLVVCVVWKQNQLMCASLLIVDMNNLITQGYAVFKEVNSSPRREKSLKVASTITTVSCFLFRCCLPGGFFLYSLLVESPIDMNTVCTVVYFIGVVFYGASNCWLVCIYVTDFKRRVLTFDLQKYKDTIRQRRTIFKALPGVPKQLYGANLINHLMKIQQTDIDIANAPYKLNNVTRPPNSYIGINITKNKI